MNTADIETAVESYLKTLRVMFERSLRETRKDGSTRWQVWLTRTMADATRQISSPYTMGSALKDPPDVTGVIYSLLSDAQSTDQDFWDWCSELGIDPSRESEQTYNACCANARQLAAMFEPCELEHLQDLLSDY